MEDNRRVPEQPDGSPQDARWELPGYEHGRELGAGAAGRVVLARHQATGTQVAVKYLTGEAAEEHERLRTEAELLGSLDSPHVARLYEYVEGPQGAAIVMELVGGVSLRDLLRLEGATAPEAALTVLKGSLLGLAAAHDAGVVHRDYKPGNVLVTTDGGSKLVDFGIAVRTGDSGDISGTPAYMAPEQWAGQAASPATDVYAATATFFECLTGAKPYAGTTVIELAVAHTEGEIPEDQAPEPLRPLIRSGLAKTPEERPPGAAALVAELETVAGAAYGEDWEERGRDQLAALVALLALLLPSAGGPAAGTTALATTRLGDPAAAGTAGVVGARLGRRARTIGAAAVGVALVAGALAGVATAGATDPTAITNLAAPAATTTLSPPPATPADPTPTVAPPPSATPSPSDPPSPSPSASPSHSPSASPTPKPSASATPTPTTPTTPPAGPSPSPSPTHGLLHVRGISLKTTCADLYTAQATGVVTSDGAGPGTVTVTWTDSTGKQVGSTVVDLPPGQQSVQFTSTQPFNNARSLTAQAVTTPAAATGTATSQPLGYYTCNPPR